MEVAMQERIEQHGLNMDRRGRDLRDALERLRKSTPGSEAESTAAYECLTTIAEWQKAGQAYIEEITEQVMDANQQLSEARSRGDI